MAEFDSARELLKIIYWTLAWTIPIVILIALVTDAMSQPHNGGAPRLVGLILIGIEAIVWVWLSTKGREMF